LRNAKAARKPSPRRVAVLADPVFDRTDGRVTGTEPIRKLYGTSSETTARPESIAAATSTQGDAAMATTLSLPRGLMLRSAADTGAVSRGLSFPRLAFSRREADAIVGEAEPDQTFEALDFDSNRSTAV